MFSRDVNDLKKEEPEKDGTDYGAYFKNIIVFVVFIYAFIVVVISSFGKIGEKKIQTTGTEMKANLDFDLEVYPP